jgi:hypothetical protein
MKAILVSLLGSSILLLSGCGTMIIKKPEASNVKKMAIISIYANTDIHDVEAKEGTKVNMLKALMASALPEKDIETDEMIQIATYGLKSFGEELEGVGVWQVLPPNQVITSKKFKALTKADESTSMGSFINAMQKIAGASWATPPGMPFIPIDKIVERGGTTVVYGKKSPYEEARERLAELCKGLNVDGVAIIRLDLAYRREFFSGMSASGLLDSMLDVRGSATPMVAADIVVVTKDAQIAVDNCYTCGGVKHVEGKSAPMMKNNRPSLKDPKGESVNSYFAAIQKYAAAVKSRMIEEFAKK